MSKTLIVVIGQRPVFKGDIPANVSTEDACGIQMCLDEQGIESYIQTSSRVKVGSTGRWKTSQSKNWNDFDRLIIFNQELQFFGGAMSVAQRLFFNQVCAFNGEIWYFLSDPLFYNRNEFTETIERLEKKNLVNPVDLEMMKANEHKGDYVNCYAVHPNIDYVKSLNPVTKQIQFIDQIRKSVLDVRTYPSIPAYDKKYGLYYAGIKRPERRALIKDLKFLGQDHIKLDGPVAGEAAVSVPEVTKNLCEHRCTIILGDVGHHNVGLNHRLLQALKCRTVAFIHAPIDTGGHLIKNEELKQYLYCDEMHQVVTKMHRLRENKFFERILKLQDEELERIKSETADELSNRIINDEKIRNHRGGVHGSSDCS